RGEGGNGPRLERAGDDVLRAAGAGAEQGMPGGHENQAAEVRQAVRLIAADEMAAAELLAGGHERQGVPRRAAHHLRRRFVVKRLDADARRAFVQLSLNNATTHISSPAAVFDFLAFMRFPAELIMRWIKSARICLCAARAGYMMPAIIFRMRAVSFF